MTQPFAALKGNILVINLDTFTTTSSTAGHLEQGHPDDVAAFVAVLPRPGQATQDFLDAIGRQEGWKLISTPPYSRTLEVEIPI